MGAKQSRRASFIELGDVESNLRATMLHSSRNMVLGVVVNDRTIDELEESATQEEIDATIDLIAPMYSDQGRVIRHYRPHRAWLWRRWYGTVFQYGLKTAASFMALAAFVSFIVPLLGDPEDGDDSVGYCLRAFNLVWKYVLTLTTFILAFFLNQSYALWRDAYNLSRALQDRASDLSMLLATHSDRDGNGKYTPEAKKLNDEIASAMRFFFAMVYASETRAFRILHTDRALERMVERDVTTQEIVDALHDLSIEPADRVFAIIEWIIIKFRLARENGTLKGTPGFDGQYLSNALNLRSSYSAFGNLLSARIPLAYGHFVQIMVDVLLFSAPLACYKEMGYFSIVAVGILSIFFAGLLDLSKVMLDPLDNEDYCDGAIDLNVGVFIRESNNASVKFYKGAERLPSGWL
uniref:Bestrophin homolog n=1 Tax=Trieres chinensis TaxID=1514140 RepID=A0A7S1ZNA5_TRICV